MTDSPEEFEEKEESFAKTLSEASESMSEVSEELDSALWVGRISMAWDAIRSAATATQDASEWLVAWMPATIALQKIGARVLEIGSAIRQNVTEDEGPDLSEEILLQFRDDLAALADVFPDAGHILGGVEVVDAAVERVLESDLAREQGMNLLRGIERLTSDLVGAMIGIWMNPEAFEITPEQATLYLTRVEALLQRLIDRIVDQYRPD